MTAWGPRMVPFNMGKLWGGGDEYGNESSSQRSTFQWLKGLLYRTWNYRIGLKFGIPFKGPKIKDEFVNQAFLINTSGFLRIKNVLVKIKYSIFPPKYIRYCKNIKIRNSLFRRNLQIFWWFFVIGLVFFVY